MFRSWFDRAQTRSNIPGPVKRTRERTRTALVEILQTTNYNLAVDVRVLFTHIARGAVMAGSSLRTGARSIWLLAAWCTRQASGRFYLDNRGPQTHEHTFLFFCGDDGDDGGVCTGQCKYSKAALTWPLHADGLTYLTHPTCTASTATCTGTMASHCTGTIPAPTTWATGIIGGADDTRDPLIYPFGGANPMQSSAPANVAQPVMAPIGKRETNPHHLRWPLSREPHVSGNSVGAKLALLRTNALALGVNGGEASETSEISKLVQFPWDAHLLNVWDRIQMRDGELLSTKFDRCPLPHPPPYPRTPFRRLQPDCIADHPHLTLPHPHPTPPLPPLPPLTPLPPPRDPLGSTRPQSVRGSAIRW